MIPRCGPLGGRGGVVPICRPPCFDDVPEAHRLFDPPAAGRVRARPFYFQCKNGGRHGNARKGGKAQDGRSKFLYQRDQFRYGVHRRTSACLSIIIPAAAKIHRLPARLPSSRADGIRRTAALHPAAAHSPAVPAGGEKRGAREAEDMEPGGFPTNRGEKRRRGRQGPAPARRLFGGGRSLQTPKEKRRSKADFAPALVRQMGLEPIRSRTRPSNVPVCLFQHCRARNQYSGRAQDCQLIFAKIGAAGARVLQAH